MQDKEKYAPLLRKALQLLARASATVVQDLSKALTHFIMVLRVLMDTATNAAMNAAVHAIINVVILRFLDDSVSQGCVLPLSSYVVQDCQTARQLQTDYYVAETDIDSSGVVMKSTTFNGILISLGALWKRDDQRMKHVPSQIMEGA